MVSHIERLLNDANAIIEKAKGQNKTIDNDDKSRLDDIVTEIADFGKQGSGTVQLGNNTNVKGLLNTVKNIQNNKATVERAGVQASLFWQSLGVIQGALESAASRPDAERDSRETAKIKRKTSPEDLR